MRKPCITLIAGGSTTKRVLHGQLQQLLGDYIDVKSYAMDEEIPSYLREPLLLFSSEVVKQEAFEKLEIQCEHFFVGKRMIHHEYIDQLLKIPENKKVLLVNDNYSETTEFIESLYQLGINHIQFVPFHIGQLYYKDIDTAVTPGEPHLCPPFIPNIIDVHVRLFDMITILKLVDYCHLHTDISSRISERYIRNIVELHKKLLSADQKTKLLNDHLQKVVDSVDDGVLAVNSQQELTVFNHHLEALFQLSSQNILHKPIRTLLPAEIVDFILHGNENSKFFTVKGIEIVIFRSQMSIENTIVATFKSVNQAFEIEKAAQRQLKKKGLYAKYDLQDIIGHDPKILQCKTIAKKLAKSEHPVFIQGETGTGKELFANAIHLHSPRKSGPFLAVNCSALTESLLESELFGYEDGAFTGAKKGGKKGLFELADNGTLFLDEIGDISLNVQAHLLRVLQENEIRRIGGDKIIPINVRIIAATNKNLQDKIKAGTFRSDLYYRLNVLTFSIPPLRERKSDIPLLVDSFIKKHRLDIKIENQVMNFLLQHEWPGNIRELKSVVDYMLTVCENHLITENDIPSNGLTPSITQERSSLILVESKLEQDEYLFILNAIKACNDFGKAASREWISSYSKESKYYLSPQQVRKRLDFLESQDLIIKGKGRAGTKITSKGVNFLSSYINQ